MPFLVVYSLCCRDTTAALQFKHCCLRADSKYKRGLCGSHSQVCDLRWSSRAGVLELWQQERVSEDSQTTATTSAMISGTITPPAYPVTHPEHIWTALNHPFTTSLPNMICHNASQPHEATHVTGWKSLEPPWHQLCEWQVVTALTHRLHSFTFKSWMSQQQTTTLCVFIFLSCINTYWLYTEHHTNLYCRVTAVHFHLWTHATIFNRERLARGLKANTTQLISTLSTSIF